MTVPLILCALVASADISFPLLPTPGRDVDPRLRWLSKDDVRKDPKRLAAALDDIWKMMPEPAYTPEQQRGGEIAKHLVWFIALDAPADVRREGLVSGHTGVQIFNMLLHIGLPAVPALLSTLSYPLPDTKDAHLPGDGRPVHRGDLRQGGDGRRMAVERIKMYAESHGYPPERKKRILSALELGALKPSPPPVERPPGK